MPKWLLPEHISDILPAQARRLEELRRTLLDRYRSYGYELVIPPLLEHLESLLTGAGHDLDLRTFKLVDQLSGRTLGVRPDITPQVARIDAHLLNRTGVVRLCYSGSVLHARPRGMHGNREPIQIGAELYGHEGLEADIEIAELALDSARLAGAQSLRMDVAHVGIVRALLGQLPAGIGSDEVVSLLQAKDAPGLEAMPGLPGEIKAALVSLCDLYGGCEVVLRARKQLPAMPQITLALDALDTLISALPVEQVSVDLGDLRGYQYHSGIMFAVYASGMPNALVRGGRYDDVGRAFGRARAATGFSLDLRELVTLQCGVEQAQAIRAPWNQDPALRAAISLARKQGEIVVQVLPHHEHEPEGYACNRELKLTDAGWQIVELDGPAVSS
jgi:ATP phosphoribosyltransferase regulatory subunit